MFLEGIPQNFNKCMQNLDKSKKKKKKTLLQLKVKTLSSYYILIFGGIQNHYLQ